MGLVLSLRRSAISLERRAWANSRKSSRFMIPSLAYERGEGKAMTIRATV